MESKIDYKSFLDDFDKKLERYRLEHANNLCCSKGCASCCKKGDYPVSELELRYLMQGYSALDNALKIIVQKNIKSVKKGGACPFLINNLCSVYSYRPIICRVHGLAYLKGKKVIVPYCVNEGLNYKDVYSEGEFLSEPILEDLNTKTVLKDFDFGEIRNLYDWFL